MEQWSTEQREAFGKRLREARGARSQVDVAAMFDIEKQAVSHWEVGRNLPSIERVALMAAEFEVSLEWLVTGVRPAWPFGADPPASAVASMPAELFAEARGMLRALATVAEKRKPQAATAAVIYRFPRRRRRPQGVREPALSALAPRGQVVSIDSR